MGTTRQELVMLDGELLSVLGALHYQTSSPYSGNYDLVACTINVKKSHFKGIYCLDYKVKPLPLLEKKKRRKLALFSLK